MCGTIGNRQYVNCWIEGAWIVLVGSLLNNIVQDYNEKHWHIEWRLQAYYLQQLGIMTGSFIWRIVLYK